MLKKFKSLTIKFQLLLGFSIMILLIIGVGTFSHTEVLNLAGLTTKMYNHPLTVSKAVRDANIAMVSMQRDLRNVVLAKNLETLNQAADSVRQDVTVATDNLAIIKARFLGDTSDIDKLEQAFVDWKPIWQEIIALAKADRAEDARNITQGKGGEQVAKLDRLLQKVTDFANNKADEFLAEAQRLSDISSQIIILVIVLATFIGLSIAFLIAHTVTQPLNTAVTIANTIALGKLDNQIDTHATSETGKLLKALASMQTQLQERIQSLNSAQTALKTQLEENERFTEQALRINQALDNATTNVLITDEQKKIIYLNNALQTFFKHKASEIQASLSHFDCAHLVGTDVGMLYNDHQQHISHTNSSFRFSTEIGRLTIDSTVTPVITQSGEQVGTVFELKDRTLEVEIEQEINAIVQAASHGNFHQAIRTDNKSGFFKMLSESVNQLISFNRQMIEDIMRVFSGLSKGDLTQTISNQYAGAFEQLKADINQTVKQLVDIIVAIQEATLVVNDQASRIAEGNTALSQRTEEQASALEQTASSMEQMTSTIQQNANNVERAVELATEANDKAKRGGEVINTTNMAMTNIVESSKQIADIINVMNDIAFQTNLLALNAAVESARAGEQGRGFAVVATEVRNLAQRSAEAAKKIQVLIQDSVSKVEEGKRLTNVSGQTLAGIMEATSTVVDIIREITSANIEQSAGIHQVNKAIVQMDETTQKNATMVVEIANASEIMRDQAESLREQVILFNTGKKVQVSTNVPLKFKPEKLDTGEEWEDF